MAKHETAQLFDAHYYATGCGEPYEREEMRHFFRQVAQRIHSDIAPQTVLDAGCATGYLVHALHQQGSEAFGVDVSEYAISQVDPSISQFCRVGSITEPFERRYDLITCIEVLEHLPKEESEAALVNLCQHTDDILFSSSPFDYREATHFNVQPPEYWAEHFARQGFFRHVDFDASFITPWAVRFTRRSETTPFIIKGYERRFWQLWQENTDLRAQVLENRQQLAAQASQQAQLQATTTTELQTLAQKLTRLAHLEQERRQLENSPGGRILRTLQTLRATLAPPGSRRDGWLTALLRQR